MQKVKRKINKKCIFLKNKNLKYDIRLIVNYVRVYK